MSKKRLPFVQRCEIDYPVDVKPHVVGFPKVIQNVIDGKVVSQVEFVVEDHENDEYEYNDFALENLLAAGADLKQMSFNSDSLLAVDVFVRNSELLKQNLESLKS